MFPPLKSVLKNIILIEKYQESYILDTFDIPKKWWKTPRRDSWLGNRGGDSSLLDR